MLDRENLGVNMENCTGCGACRSACPAGAVSMQPDREGFLYPVIDREKCIHCGLCSFVCPECENKGERRKAPEPQSAFAVMADEGIRRESSSGGLFTLLAEQVLERGGAAAGAVWTEDWKAKHAVVCERDGLDRLRRSKYVQSDLGDVLNEVKGLLEAGKWVLFSGCPCQTAGLYTYLGKEYDRLITVDLVCHGAPSPLAFEKYIREISGGKKVTEINFRSKKRGWGTPSSIQMAGGFSYFRECGDDPWYMAFLNGISTRKSCGTCRYACPERVGDVTLGDFWGVSEIAPEWDDRIGTGLVLLNTEKGRRIFDGVRPRLKLAEQVPFERVKEIAKRRNGQLLSPRPAHKNREQFFRMLGKAPFSSAVLAAAEKKYDVGIVGWWYNENYGGTLTYFALNRILEEMGLTVLMIERASVNPSRPVDTSTIPRRFARKYYNISRIYHPYKMGELNHVCSAFISGSDQLFSPYLWEYSGPPYYLDFVDPSKNMISYASSFGNSYEAEEKFKMTVSYYLRRFNALSVREDYGVDIMRDQFGLTAQKVLDPVFVCDPAEYDALADRSQVRPEGKYLLSFILDPDPGRRNAILYVKEQTKLPFINLIHAMDFEENARKLNLPETRANIDVEDFLQYYRNAEFIITDSFHGTCFAIIFRKPFIAIANRKRGENRFISLLKELGLLNRLVYDSSEISRRPDLLEKTDYAETERRLSVLRKESCQWLKNALFSPAGKAKSSFQVMDLKQNNSANRISRMQEEIDRLKKSLEEERNLADRVESLEKQVQELMREIPSGKKK